MKYHISEFKHASTTKLLEYIRFECTQMMTTLFSKYSSTITNIGLVWYTKTSCTNKMANFDLGKCQGIGSLWEILVWGERTKVQTYSIYFLLLKIPSMDLANVRVLILNRIYTKKPINTGNNKNIYTYLKLWTTHTK